MKKTDLEIGQRSANEFLKFWEKIIQDRPDYDKPELAMAFGIFFAVGFSKGHDFAMEDENILEKFGLN